MRWRSKSTFSFKGTKVPYTLNVQQHLMLWRSKSTLYFEGQNVPCILKVQKYLTPTIKLICVIVSMMYVFTLAHGSCSCCVYTSQNSHGFYVFTLCPWLAFFLCSPRPGTVLNHVSASALPDISRLVSHSAGKVGRSFVRSCPPALPPPRNVPGCLLCVRVCVCVVALVLRPCACSCFLCSFLFWCFLYFVILQQYYGGP